MSRDLTERRLASETAPDSDASCNVSSRQLAANMLSTDCGSSDRHGELAANALQQGSGRYVERTLVSK